MSIAYRISGFNRKRKWRLFNSLYTLTPETTILDAGFGEAEFSETDNFLEKHYPYPRRITALGIDAPVEFRRRYPDVRAVKYEGDVFPFADGSFDVCWSNAVLEHVGDRDRQVCFLKEIRRVAKSAFVTTPNRYFPVEVHTRLPLVHYLPKKYFDRSLALFGKEWAGGDYMNLLSLKEIKELLRDAGITDYRIIANRLLFFSLDFVIFFPCSPA